MIPLMHHGRKRCASDARTGNASVPSSAALPSRSGPSTPVARERNPTDPSSAMQNVRGNCMPEFSARRLVRSYVTASRSTIISHVLASLARTLTKTSNHNLAMAEAAPASPQPINEI